MYRREHNEVETPFNGSPLRREKAARKTARQRQESRQSIQVLRSFVREILARVHDKDAICVKRSIFLIIIISITSCKILKQTSNPRSHDKNGNGTLSQSEFASLLSSLHLQFAQQDIDALAKKYDVDRNGNIDYVELQNGLLGNYQDHGSPKHMFRRYVCVWMDVSAKS